jgi:WD40 repeat protein/Flp pilus assembly protein TadD
LRARADSIAWSSDGTTLAIPARDQKIDLWETATGTPRATVEGLKTGGVTAAFHPSDALFASNGWSAQLRLWDPVLGRPLLNMTSQWGPEFSADGRMVVALDDQLRLYQVDPALEYRTFAHASSEAITYARASIRHDGRVLAVGTDRGAVLWDLVRGRELAVLPIGNAWHLMFEQSGNLITSGTAGVYRWPIQLDLGHGEFGIGPPRPLHLPVGLSGIAEDRSGRIVAKPIGAAAYVTTPRGTIMIDGLNDCRALAVSPDGQYLATGSHLAGQGAQVWRISDRKKMADLALAHSAGVEFSPDGRWLSTLSTPSRLWEVSTWREVMQIGGDARCFSPDGRLVLVSDSNMVLRLVETETGRTLARFESPDSCDVGWATFSPDGSRLVVTTNDGPAVHVWDLRTIRAHLAGMGLDWDAPACSELDPAGPSSPPLPPLRVDFGALTDHLQHITASAPALVERYTARLKEEPNDADTYHHRAHAFVKLGRYPEAIDDLTRAIRLRPGDAHYRVVRGGLYHGLSQLELAVADLEAAFALNPDEYDVRASLASCCNDRAWELVDCPEPRRDLRRAAALGHRAVEMVPDEQRYLNTLAVVHYRAGRYAETVATLNRGLAASKGEADAYDLFFLAMAQHRLGRRDRAREAFDRAVHLVREPDIHSAEDAQSLTRFRAEAEAVLAGPAGELPEDVFARPR